MLSPALGGSERFLVSGGSHPSWSPEGTRIRYFPDSMLQHDVRLKVISATGDTSPEVLPNLANAAERWFWVAAHPDGRFSFMGWPPNGGHLGFYTASSDGQVTQSEIKRNLPPQLQQFLNGARDTYGRHFTWNATGTALVLETMADNGVSNLWRIGVNPRTLEWTSFQQLTTGTGADVGATFSPDGAHILFSTLRTSRRAWRLPLDAKGDAVLPGQPITEDQADVTGLSVSPDGNMAIFNLQRFGSPDRSTLWTKHLDSGLSEPVGTDGMAAMLSPKKDLVAYHEKARRGVRNLRAGARRADEASHSLERELVGRLRLERRWRDSGKPRFSARSVAHRGA